MVKLPDKKLLISAGVLFLFAVMAFNFESITGSAIDVKTTKISLSTDGENFIDNPSGNQLTLSAGDFIYIKTTPAENNKRVFLYDPRHSSKADTFETKCFEKQGSKCISSLAVYKTPTDTWLNGVYTVKLAGVSGEAEFALQDSTYKR